jgi:NhaP-type Na+/H+ and K+/H+ antiporter
MTRATPRVRLVFNVAFLIERLSRNIQGAPPKAPPARLRFNRDVRGLNLEQAVYAARQPPARYEFIREDEHFRRVERLLQNLE